MLLEITNSVELFFDATMILVDFSLNSAAASC